MKWRRGKVILADPSGSSAQQLLASFRFLARTLLLLLAASLGRNSPIFLQIASKLLLTPLGHHLT
jgi:hypothetical protein